MTYEVKWIDHFREPKCAANPHFPSGLDIISPNASGKKSCKFDLPYPAKRCGHYQVTCKTCGLIALATTAGRADDPKSITVPCKELLR